MSSESNETDRRRGPPSRRQADMYCSEHHLRWEHHDTDAKEHRGVVCGKIKSLGDMMMTKADVDDFKQVQADLRSMTPWKVFALAMLIIIAMTGWTHKTIIDSQDKMSSAVDTIHRRITDADRDVSNRLHNIEQQLHKN